MRYLLGVTTEIDLIRVQDAELSGADDPAVLAWAARAGRVLLTHDVQSLIGHAYARVQRGEGMRGVFEVGREVPNGAAIDDLLLLAECSLEGEREGQVRHLPLR